MRRPSWGFLITMAVFVLCLATLMGHSQDKKVDNKNTEKQAQTTPKGVDPGTTMHASDAAKPGKEATQESQLKILKAKVALTDAQKELAAMESQYQQLQNSIKDLQANAKPVQQKITLQQSILQSEEDAGARALGLDPAKYTFDEEKLVYNPKPEPAPATPSPAKK